MLILLDANILFHTSLRSFFCYLHESGYLSIRLSKRIIDEWKINYALYVKKENGFHEEIETFDAFISKYPDVLVTNYENLAKKVKLFDMNDHHVLQAAIKCNAVYIITYNTKDFPKSRLRPFSIEALNPHVFFPKISVTMPLHQYVDGYILKYNLDKESLDSFIKLKIYHFEK